MKKFLVSALSIILVFTMIVSASIAEAASFVDIEDSYAKDAILKLQESGIIDGMDDAHFDPKGTLTRAQFVAIIVRALGLAANATVSSFNDVDGWQIPYVEAAYNLHIIEGVSDGSFAPNDSITREAAATILVRALKTKGLVDESATLNFADADTISAWAKPFIAIAQKYGLISGYPDGTFQPQGTANREMAAMMGNNLLIAIIAVINAQQPAPATPTPTPTPTATPTPIFGGGGGGGGGGCYGCGGGGSTPTPTPATPTPAEPTPAPDAQVEFLTKPSFEGAPTSDFQIKIDGQFVTDYSFYYDGKLLGKDRNGVVTSIHHVFSDLTKIKIESNSGAVIVDSNGEINQ